MGNVYLKIKKVKIEKGYHFHLNLKINGYPAIFVIDTGASQSVLNIKRIQHFNVKENKNAKSATVSGIEPHKFSNTYSAKVLLNLDSIHLLKEFVLMDLDHINSLYKTMHIAPIDGILGSEILVKLKAKIDIENKKLILVKP